VKSRSTRSLTADRSRRGPWSDSLAPHGALPAVLCHQPLDRAPGRVVAPAAQMEPPRAGTEPGQEPLLTCGQDQIGDLGVAQRAFRGSTGPGLVVGAGGDRTPVLAQHGADRIDPQSRGAVSAGSPSTRSPRCSSMKAISSSVGGRAPPRRMPRPTSGSGWPAQFLGVLARTCHYFILFQLMKSPDIPGRFTRGNAFGMTDNRCQRGRILTGKESTDQGASPPRHLCHLCGVRAHRGH
jgi:hypothetical protein